MSTLKSSAIFFISSVFNFSSLYLINPVFSSTIISSVIFFPSVIIFPSSLILLLKELKSSNLLSDEDNIFVIFLLTPSCNSSEPRTKFGKNFCCISGTDPFNDFSKVFVKS